MLKIAHKYSCAVVVTNQVRRENMIIEHNTVIYFEIYKFIHVYIFEKSVMYQQISDCMNIIINNGFVNHDLEQLSE